jgi:hypothetical protein
MRASRCSRFWRYDADRGERSPSPQNPPFPRICGELGEKDCATLTRNRSPDGAFRDSFASA